MTHPDDRVYRFRRLVHWGRGHGENLMFGSGADEALSTATALRARRVGPLPGCERVRGLARDPAGRLIVVGDEGGLWALHGDTTVRIGAVSPGLVDGFRRLILGQRVGWIASDGGIVRFDRASGEGTGDFAVSGCAVVDAVPDFCDGVIVTEEPATGGPARLRQIRPEGGARVLPVSLATERVVAAVRHGDRGPIHIVDLGSGGWKVHRIEPGDGSVRASAYALDPARTPSRIVTADGPGRLVFAAADRAVFSAAEGLLEPRVAIDGPRSMGAIVDLMSVDARLYAATAAALFLVEADASAASHLEARYRTPVLRSPLGDRQGWQRADLFAELPEGAQVTIRSRGFARRLDADHYQGLLRANPADPFVLNGWSEETASVHDGAGDPGPLRHFLGQVGDEYLALQIDISLPAGARPIRIAGLDVLYPDRSLIGELPDLYATGGAGELKVRRMLAPFQALADEIDDLIGAAVRRVDPETADELWAGFLLGWLGHGTFAGLPADLRRALLRAMPEILPRRGTLAGLARVMAALAPRGFRIEDASLRPDIWVLPRPDDPVGARLGCDTAAAHHRPEPLVLGGCPSLGSAVLGDACFDPAALRTCGASVTVFVYGSDAAEAEIGPFVDRIVAAFVPANTRVRFAFGATPPPDTLGAEPSDDRLLTLDAGTDPRLGAWTLPGSGPSADRGPRTLDDAVLDGSLILG